MGVNVVGEEGEGERYGRGRREIREGDVEGKREKEGRGILSFRVDRCKKYRIYMYM